MQMRAVYDYLARNLDVVMVQAARDRQGLLRLGPNVDFASAALAAADTVLVEINEGIIAPAGSLILDEAGSLRASPATGPLRRWRRR